MSVSNLLLTTKKDSGLFFFFSHACHESFSQSSNPPSSLTKCWWNASKKVFKYLECMPIILTAQKQRQKDFESETSLTCTRSCFQNKLKNPIHVVWGDMLSWWKKNVCSDCRNYNIKLVIRPPVVYLKQQANATSQNKMKWTIRVQPKHHLILWSHMN